LRRRALRESVFVVVKLSMVHVIACEPSAYWEAFFDEALCRRLFLEGLGFREWSVLAQSQEGSLLRRTVSVEPTLSVPGAIQKLAGDRFRYTEEGTFDRTTETFRFKLVPSKLADKVRVEGTMTTKALAKKTERRVDMTIEASIALVGRLVEESFAKQLEEGWPKGADKQNEWLAAQASGQ
jgi:hypothetical protein